MEEKLEVMVSVFDGLRNIKKKRREKWKHKSQTNS